MDRRGGRGTTLEDVSPHQPDLRASDADREATGERLRIAALEGRLDPIELDARLSATYAARYCSELARLTADVTPPAAVAPAPPAPTFVRRGPTTNAFAVASMVIGLVWAWWIGSLLRSRSATSRCTRSRSRAARRRAAASPSPGWRSATSVR